jgi:hypothetical protein
LYDDLVAEFGANSVFMDVANIRPGLDFRKAIDQSLSSCAVFLSVIGVNWLDAKDLSGHRRLDDPADFVRLEISAALKRDIPVIPVLVQGASLPQPEQLPEDLRDLLYRNALELTHPRWPSDVQFLIQALRAYVQSPPQLGGTQIIRPEGGPSLRGEDIETVLKEETSSLVGLLGGLEINDVDRVLQEFLRWEMPNIFKWVDITFAIPDAEFPPQSVSVPAVDLYLYDVEQKPRNVVFSYMITAWPSPSVPDPTADEHRILSEVASLFNKHPIISSKAIQEMRLSKQRKSTRTKPKAKQEVEESCQFSLALQPLNNRDFVRLWQSLGTRPKLALGYSVTVNIDYPKSATNQI